MPPRGPRGPRRGVAAGGIPTSRSGRAMVNGRVVNPFAAPAGGNVHTPVNGPIDSYVTYSENVRHKMSHAIQRKGALVGSLVGIRHILTNGLHTCVFNRKIQLAEKALKAEQISQEQCNLRKMRAAAEYFDHLKKIGYYNDADVSLQMYMFAQSIGVEYEDDTVSHGRSR